MRIIAGDAKGRNLFTPKNQDVRPTGDRVKESIFSMIDSYIEDAVVIDMFAGTGNLGLESISRGAREAYFIDNNYTSIDIVKKNIETTGYFKESHVIHANYEKAIKNLNIKADIIFLDPPYNKGHIDNCLRLISKYGILSSKGIIVIEHSTDEIWEDISDFELLKSKKYGITMISILRNLV
ncbi:MAG: 16S rRNA (guanine(966)-N(2))-methyltransferase RsmD [Clostridiales bacterium]|nr:16S rRNA (guanine(966)-N(2))-methyltransferase RsmD [Clostridiales bacterium]